VVLASVSAEGYDATRLEIATTAEQFEVDLPLVGLYNAYNALAAAAVCSTLRIKKEHIVDGLASFQAVFGRQERIAVGEGAIILSLVKNPVGFNQSLQALLSSELRVPGSQPVGGEANTRNSAAETMLVIAINDLFADGTDVSWLWDVDFEMLADRSLSIFCTGLRAHDMALRLKYAGVAGGCVDVEESLPRSVDRAVRAAAAGDRVVFCPTYPALLEVRAELARRGVVSPFWED